MAVTLIPEYKFYVTHNAVTTQVYPSFDGDISIDSQKQGDNISLLDELKGTLIFSNRNGVTDYDYFLDIETNDFCATLTLDIQQRCGSTTYASIFTCEFGVSDGEWDKHSCTFSVEPVSVGNYRKMFLPVKVNIIDVTPSTSFDGFEADGTVYTINRMRNFADMVLYVAQQTNSNITGIVSDFFQINPVTVSTVNYVTGAENVYTSMMCGSLSEVRSPQPTNAATREEITWIELMDDLRVMFNVFWYIDGTDIVIEHYNRFNTTAGLDLTTSQYAEWVSGTNKYNYDSKESPRFEEWNMSSSDQGCTIEYDNACGSIKLNEDKKTFTVKKLYTDIYRCINDSSQLSGGTRGIFICATWDLAGTDYIRGSTTEGNDEMLLPRLVLRFHRYGRPQLEGVFTFNAMNGDATNINYGDLWNYSEAPRKLQTDVTIPFCCDDEFISSETVTTFMGDGVVRNASHNLYDNTLKLKLAYKINADNVDVLPSAISNLALWCIGDTGKTITLGKVTQWNDQSGNGNHFIQPTGADAPTDGTTHLVFSGDMMFTTTSWQTFPAKRGSIFIVSSTNDFGGGTDKTLLAIDGANKWDMSYIYVFNAGYGLDSYYLYSFDLTADYDSTGFLMTANYPYGWYDTPILFELIRDSDTTQNIFVNGRPILNNAMTIPNALPSVDNVILGGIDATNKRYTGKIYEVIMYDRDLTDIERQKVEQYLSKKYEMNLYQAS